MSRPDDNDIIRMLDCLSQHVDVGQTRGQTREGLIDLKREAAEMAQQLSEAACAPQPSKLRLKDLRVLTDEEAKEAAKAMGPVKGPSPQLPTKDGDYDEDTAYWKAVAESRQHTLDQAYVEIERLRALIPVEPQSFPKWRHLKRGSIVTEVARGFAQVAHHPIEEMTAVVIYKHDADGVYWVRNAVEFDDGRFEPYPLTRPQSRSGK